MRGRRVFGGKGLAVERGVQAERPDLIDNLRTDAQQQTAWEWNHGVGNATQAYREVAYVHVDARVLVELPLRAQQREPRRHRA